MKTSTPNTFMTYPRHGLLLICDWINFILAIAIVAVGAYRTWGVQSGFRNRMDIVVITAVSPIHLLDQRRLTARVVNQLYSSSISF